MSATARSVCGVLVLLGCLAGCGGGGSDSTGSNNTGGNPGQSPPTATLTTDLAVIDEGSSVVLTWASTNAQNCEAKGAWQGPRPLSGTETIGPLTSASAFSIACTGLGGSVETTASVDVQALPPRPTVSLTVSRPSIASGSTAVLTWSTENTSTCEASGAWSGTKAPAGSEQTTALSATSLFRLSCNGRGGASEGTVEVVVVQPPLLTLSATQSTVPFGGETTIQWSSSGATSCSGSGDWAGPLPILGTRKFTGLNSDATYVLTCVGEGGSSSRSIDIAVGNVPLPTLSLTAPAAVATNRQATLRWSSSNADQCTASGGWAGTRASVGEAIVGPLTSPTDFMLSCTGVGGTSTATVTVAVANAPPLLSFTPIALRDVAFVERGGRPDHEGWYQQSGAPLIGAQAAFLQLRLTGDISSVTFDLEADDGSSLGSVSLLPDPDGVGRTHLYRGRSIVPAQPFVLRARGLAASGTSFSLVSQRIVPSDFRVTLPSPILMAASGDSGNLVLRLENPGTARIFDITFSQNGAGLLPIAKVVSISLANGETRDISVAVTAVATTTVLTSSLGVVMAVTGTPEIAVAAASTVVIRP